jgi:SAM-dependent methyltransferase
MPRNAANVRVGFTIPGSPLENFSVLVEEISSSLRRRGWRVKLGARGFLRPPAPRRTQPETLRIVWWRPGRRATFRWTAANGGASDPSELDLRLSRRGGQTVVSLEHRGGTRIRGEPASEQRLGWVAGEILGAEFVASSPAEMQRWRTDRSARRPSGPTGRAQYREPIFHRPNFAEILRRLSLGPRENLLEVGCGGGAFLKEALRSGCRASALDHSPDLLEVARAQNARAVRSGRLRLEFGDATRLPFPSSRFTTAVMTGVLCWLPDPDAVFGEIYRCLRPNGRVLVYDGTPRMYGTPAAGPKTPGGPRLYTDRGLGAFARRVGFTEIRVDRPDLRGFARDCGVASEWMYLFQPSFNHILEARKPAG